MDRSGSETSCAQVSSGSLGSGSAGSGSLGVLYSRFGNFTSCKIIQDHARQESANSCTVFVQFSCDAGLCVSLIFTEHCAGQGKMQRLEVWVLYMLYMGSEGISARMGLEILERVWKGNGNEWKIWKMCLDEFWCLLCLLLLAALRCLVRSWMELNGAGADRFDLRSACIGGREGPEMDEIWIWFKPNLFRLSQGWLKRYHKNI